MADRVKEGISVFSGPSVILQRPELAALIGCVCADWAYIENSLIGLYGTLMGVYLPQPPGYEPPLHPVARQVLSEVQSIRSRISLVKKLAEWVVTDLTLKKDMLEALDRLSKAAAGRNLVAHGLWGISDAEPDALILIPSFGHQMVYKKFDFDAIRENILTALQEVHRVHYAFVKIRRKK